MTVGYTNENLLYMLYACVDTIYVCMFGMDTGLGDFRTTGLQKTTLTYEINFQFAAQDTREKTSFKMNFAHAKEAKALIMKYKYVYFYSTLGAYCNVKIGKVLSTKQPHFSISLIFFFFSFFFIMK